MNKKLGVLLAVSSLPSRHGIGDFGDECYKFIDENFEDYYQDEWDEEEDGVFDAKEMGKDWLKTELHLEVVDLEKDNCTLSESLANLLK